MTDRKPDFYRVVRIMNGHREYLNSAHNWTRDTSSAWSYETKSHAASASDARPGTRIVPVYVKVTRKPKLHDFGWALRRMREGKKVARASWYNGSHIPHENSIGANMGLFGVVRADTEGNSRTCVSMSDLLATDWQLYEPEATP